MTTAILQGYKWASGFNNASALKPVEVDVPTFQNKPFYVHGLGAWDNGILRSRGDMTVGSYGLQRFTWGADIMSDEQYQFIQAKSPGGNGFSVKMTVRTRRGSSFSNYSATLQLPKTSDLTRIWNAYRDVPLLFIVEAAL